MAQTSALDLSARTDPIQRMSIVIRGAVQGVGFRPFVYRLARELELAGWVGNSLSGVLVEVEGGAQRLEAFLVRLEKENVRLLDGAVEGLRDAGFRPGWHQRIPPNDGGIALGQIVAAARSFTGGPESTPAPGKPGTLTRTALPRAERAIP